MDTRTNKRWVGTPLGSLEVTGKAKVCRIFFGGEPGPTAATEDDAVARQLREYFDGTRTEFELELDDSVGTPFQRRVWAELRKIPFGETRTYLDIALALGDRNLTRAVGAANRANPWTIVVPCHRVIGSDGSLTGYAAGLERKKWLLEHESTQTSLL